MVIKTVRRILSGKNANFKFLKVKNLKITPIEETSLYVHIPFCKNLCPYCPYNRIPYDENLIRPFTDALIKEIKHYGSIYSKTRVSTVYFGGGTPTIIKDELIRIVEALKNTFNIEEDFCIETNPNDLSDETVEILKKADFKSISIGVQSFNQNMLDCIGRKYNSNDIYSAVSRVKSAGFESVNIDLLFALPGQTEESLKNDIAKAIELNPDQITYYPLFTFPYSEISKYKKVISVKSPSITKRRSMYYLIYDILTSNGYNQCSVWSFKKGVSDKRYSSVTRERYLGFGPSAGSYYETHFTLNTFSVEEYINSVNERGHGAALMMNFTKQLSMIYDFYWRIYDTVIPMERKLAYSNYTLANNRQIKFVIKIMKILNWIERRDNAFVLTKSGSLWIHFIQNLFSLKAISTVWSIGKKEIWPESIEF